MSGSQRLPVLRSTTELGGFSDGELKGLLLYFDEYCALAGEVLAQEGRLCHQFVIVAAGHIEVCRNGRVTRLGPGETFGWTAMRQRGVNEATVVAASPTHLLVMSHAQFRAAEALTAS